MNSARTQVQDSADRYVAAVEAAGQAVYATRSGMGVKEIRIKRSGDDTWQVICEPRRNRGAGSNIRFLVAGEAALVTLGLREFSEVCLLTAHTDAAFVVRGWETYWGRHPHYFSLEESWDTDEVAEETSHLISVIRWQMRRRFRYAPEKRAIEELALLLREKGSMPGQEAEKLVRRICRENGKQARR